MLCLQDGTYLLVQPLERNQINTDEFTPTHSMMEAAVGAGADVQTCNRLVLQNNLARVLYRLLTGAALDAVVVNQLHNDTRHNRIRLGDALVGRGRLLNMNASMAHLIVNLFFGCVADNDVTWQRIEKATQFYDLDSNVVSVEALTTMSERMMRGLRGAAQALALENEACIPIALNRAEAAAGRRSGAFLSYLAVMIPVIETDAANGAPTRLAFCVDGELGRGVGVVRDVIDAVVRDMFEYEAYVVHDDDDAESPTFARLVKSQDDLTQEAIGRLLFYALLFGVQLPRPLHPNSLVGLVVEPTRADMMAQRMALLHVRDAHQMQFSCRATDVAECEALDRLPHPRPYVLRVGAHTDMGVYGIELVAQVLNGCMLWELSDTTPFVEFNRDDTLKALFYTMRLRVLEGKPEERVGSVSLIVNYSHLLQALARQPVDVLRTLWTVVTSSHSVHRYIWNRIKTLPYTPIVQGNDLCATPFLLTLDSIPPASTSVISVLFRTDAAFRYIRAQSCDRTLSVPFDMTPAELDTALVALTSSTRFELV
jgi:hypothetical protein